MQNGTIVIMYGKDVNQKIDGSTLAIQPYVNENGDVVWQCGLSNAPAGAYADSGGQAGGGVVADSDPTAEYQESGNKAAALLRAIDEAERLVEPRVRAYD